MKTKFVQAQLTKEELTRALSERDEHARSIEQLKAQVTDLEKSNQSLQSGDGAIVEETSHGDAHE